MTEVGPRPVRSALLRALWILVGCFFVVLGFLGVFLPGLPTTPFLLLAAACFSRSSPKLYDKLLNNRWFGSAIRDYRNGLGIPRRIKLIAITTMWTFVAFAVLFAIPEEMFTARLAILIAGLVGTLYLLRLKTRVDEDPVSED